MGLESKSAFCIDGQDTIDQVVRILGECPAENLRPITLMLLDLQMPKKNGIQVVTEVRELYKQRATECPGLRLPTFVFLTAYLSTGFKKHLNAHGIS